MSNILAIALHSMHNDSVRLEKAAANLANALTAGYKREVVAVQATTYAQFNDSFAAQVDTLSGTAPAFGALQVQTDTHTGSMKSTGQTFDVALASEGYFEVSTAGGPAYTRQGDFHLDAQGRLVSAQGQPVMGKGGEIVLSSAHATIDSQGYVFEGNKGSMAVQGSGGAGRAVEEQPVAQIKVVQFEGHQNFERLGQGLVATSSPPAAMNDVDIQVRQGFLENSNVSSMQEMVELMQTMRHFESIQKVATGYDEMIGTAIRKLGDL